MMLYTFYLRKGAVYIPSIGRMETGGSREIDPVAVVPISDDAALQKAFRETVATGNPIIAGLARAGYPEPVVLKYSGVKSFTTFMRSAFAWSVEEEGGSYRIVVSGKCFLGDGKMIPIRRLYFLLAQLSTISAIG